MQIATETVTRPVAPVKATAPTKAAAPPIIVSTAAALHPVYGNVPIGKGECTLECQPIQMLNFWHEKATTGENEYAEAADRAGKVLDNDATYDIFYECRWDIFEAAFKTDFRHATDVDYLLRIIARQTENYSNDEEETPITQTRLKRLAEVARKVAEPIRPTKKVGPLSKGRKLTRAGLLHRYHAFLVGELYTLSLSLYGSRDYASRMIPIDDAVQVRVGAGFKNGKYDSRSRKVDPFFEESTLANRARGVLKSLRIDTQAASDR